MKRVFRWTTLDGAEANEVRYWRRRSMADRVSAVEVIREATLGIYGEAAPRLERVHRILAGPSSDSITGVSFPDAWRGRVEIEVDGAPIYFLGEDELRLNKASTGRAKDMLDLELLGPKPRRSAPRTKARSRAPR